MQKEHAKPLFAVFLAQLKGISNGDYGIAEACHEKSLIYLHCFVVAKTAEDEPYPIGFLFLAEMRKPAVIQIQTCDRKRQSVHEVERIAGHQVVVYVYLDERAEESREIDTVVRLGLFAYDKRDQEYVDPDGDLLKEPNRRKVAGAVHPVPESDNEREQKADSAALEVERPRVFIGKFQRPHAGIRELGHGIVTAQHGIS
jgi:hypothetical protein